MPVYNVKEYLARCLKSIIDQIYQDIEIIIVDDGSTDGSREICKQFQNIDDRIIVIYKKNEGVLLARKKGLEVAKGEYVLFVDGDDWIEANMISEMHEVAVKNNADIVTSGCYKEYDGGAYGKIIDGIQSGVYNCENNGQRIYQNLIFSGSSEKMGIGTSLWNKLIKTDLVKSVYSNINGMIYFGEDAVLVYSCCIRAKIIVITHEIYYHYIMRMGSVVHSSDLHYFQNINETYLLLREEFEKSRYKPTLLQQLDIYMVKMAFNGISYLFGLDKAATIPYYDFEKNVIEKDSRIVLYGAGRVGQAFYKQICSDKLYKLVGWVDKNYFSYQEQDFNVSAIETVKDLEYDYIILAFIHKDMAESVKKNLMKEFGIDEEKLIWLKPVSIIDKYRLV